MGGFPTLNPDVGVLFELPGERADGSVIDAENHDAGFGYPFIFRVNAIAGQPAQPAVSQCLEQFFVGKIIVSGIEHLAAGIVCRNESRRLGVVGIEEFIQIRVLVVYSKHNVIVCLPYTVNGRRVTHD